MNDFAFISQYWMLWYKNLRFYDLQVYVEDEGHTCGYTCLEDLIRCECRDLRCITNEMWLGA